jgi:D-alanine-D-alanine ligase
MKSQKHIEIVVTNTVGLDLMSESTIEKIRESLAKNYQKVSVTIIKNENDLKKLIQKKPDLVFSGVKYLGFDSQSRKRSSNTKIWLSSILKKNGINHTGSETQALKLEINKVKAKIALSKKEILTAKYFTVVPGQFKANSTLPIEFPLFIKPIHEGGGNGIDECSVVRNSKEFEKKVLHLHSEKNHEILVEKYLSGREFTVGILRNPNTKGLNAFPLELIPQKNIKGDRVLGSKDKQEDLESVVAIKEKNIFNKVAQFAKKSFEALGARDYGRIDLRMDRYNQLYFLEANLVPGLGRGYFSRSLKIVGGISYPKMINNLATLAINRACN